MTKYIESVDEVIEIHNKTIDVSGGGVYGVLNTSYLESALEHIQNDDYYPTFVDKLTHLVFEANRSHSFQDGNKRIAISLGVMFLNINGYVFLIQDFIAKMEMISYQLAAGRIDKELLKEILYSVIYEEDYSEETKIKIIECITNEELDN
ncbi:type II toxin-antitoxin system death-on-curing family toxin [Marinilabiliaceae bacterium JC040]|nr:type II toxin-antitoxin system death-on-curing family toxin [Marinilabiliaceae bacterium JC040]